MRDVVANAYLPGLLDTLAAILKRPLQLALAPIHGSQAAQRNGCIQIFTFLDQVQGSQKMLASLIVFRQLETRFPDPQLWADAPPPIAARLAQPDVFNRQGFSLGVLSQAKGQIGLNSEKTHRYPSVSLWRIVIGSQFLKYRFSLGEWRPSLFGVG